MLLVLGLLVGTGIGAVGHALVATPATQVVYRDRVVERVVLTPPPAAPVVEMPVSEAPAHAAEPKAAVRAAPLPSAVSTTEAPPEGEDDLNAELLLLDEARKSLAAGDAARALSRLEAHAERYPMSRLEQERAALRIKALIAAGRHAEARAEGDRFRQRFPKSMLRDSVDKALSSIP
jgi:hypothetical protein